MKKSIYKLALLLVLIPCIGFGAAKIPQRHERSKTVKKSYDVSDDATIEIRNKYGNVNIVTWNKNNVEIIAHITVKGNDLRSVENKLRSIEIVFQATTEMVSAKTRFETSSTSWSLWSKSDKTGYTINYTVKMPVSNNLEVSNKYGDILLNEIDGTTDINCDYGKIILGDLNNPKNTINIDYTKGSSINFMKAGYVSADYSKLIINKSDKVKINSDYSTLEIGTANTVTYNADYGSIKVKDVITLTGNSDYVSIRLGTVRKHLNLEADYGAIRINELAKGFQKAAISAAYTGITIGMQANSNFTFITDLQYAKLRCNSDRIEMRKSIEKSSNKFYEGTYGKGNSTSVLTIRSKYGSVRFKEEE